MVKINDLVKVDMHFHAEYGEVIKYGIEEFSFEQAYKKAKKYGMRVLGIVDHYEKYVDPKEPYNSNQTSFQDFIKEANDARSNLKDLTAVIGMEIDTTDFIKRVPKDRQVLPNLDYIICGVHDAPHVRDNVVDYFISIFRMVGNLSRQIKKPIIIGHPFDFLYRFPGEEERVTNAVVGSNLIFELNAANFYPNNFKAYHKTILKYLTILKKKKGRFVFGSDNHFGFQYDNKDFIKVLSNIVKICTKAGITSTDLFII